MRDCKPAFEEQKKWKQQFREARKVQDDIAADHNELTRIRTVLQQCRAQLAEPIKSESSQLVVSICAKIEELESSTMPDTQSLKRPETSEPELMKLRQEIADVKEEIKVRHIAMCEFRALCTLRQNLQGTDTAVPDAALRSAADRLRTEMKAIQTKTTNTTNTTNTNRTNHPDVVSLREELQTQIDTFYERNHAINATRDAAQLASLRARLQKSEKTESAVNALIDGYLALRKNLLCEKESGENARMLHEEIERFHDDVVLAGLWCALEQLTKEYMSLGSNPSPEFGFRVVQAEARARAATVLLDCNTANLKRVVRETKQLVTQVKASFKANRSSLHGAVLVWLTQHPTAGNRFSTLPPDIRQAVTRERTTFTSAADAKPDMSERVFIVHVSKGYKGESDAHVEMIVTFTHSTTETRQNGNDRLTIITHHYEISYRIR